jgi:hypothetical protein
VHSRSPAGTILQRASSSSPTSIVDSFHPFSATSDFLNSPSHSLPPHISNDAIRREGLFVGALDAFQSLRVSNFSNARTTCEGLCAKRPDAFSQPRRLELLQCRNEPVTVTHKLMVTSRLRVLAQRLLGRLGDRQPPPLPLEATYGLEIQCLRVGLNLDAI